MGSTERACGPDLYMTSWVCDDPHWHCLIGNEDSTMLAMEADHFQCGPQILIFVP
jgi:hypothetical protein